MSFIQNTKCLGHHRILHLLMNVSAIFKSKQNCLKFQRYLRLHIHLRSNHIHVILNEITASYLSQNFLSAFELQHNFQLQQDLLRLQKIKIFETSITSSLTGFAFLYGQKQYAKLDVKTDYRSKYEIII